ncbi:hypothetical protein QVD17_08549 [Tagetes erecta]|uniref:Uncharacterized protein n=1 Tax=Tagetes erecta TaxID=13708 RepID=A0AAD8P391_TARER|nr:hypothetical protein QVD17_08549 [Tagetes erecta]
MAGKKKGSGRRLPTIRSTRTNTNKETDYDGTIGNHDNDGEEDIMTETQFISAVANQVSKIQVQKGEGWRGISREEVLPMSAIGTSLKIVSDDQVL